MAENEKNSSNGLKLLLVVVSIFTIGVSFLALIAGLYAMTEPMGQRLKDTKDQVKEVRGDLILMKKWKEDHDRIIERRDAEQWGRIEALERRVYRQGTD